MFLYLLLLYEILQIFSASNTCVLVYFGFSFLNFQIVHLFSKIAFTKCGAFSPGFKLLALVGMVCETRYTNLPF